MTVDALVELYWDKAEAVEDDPTCGGCVSGVNPWHSHPGWQWVATATDARVRRSLRFVITRLATGTYELEQARIHDDGTPSALTIRWPFPSMDAAKLEATRRANRPLFSGEVDVGGEPYDVDDEGRGLTHVPCGEWLNGGEDTLARHLCWWDRPAEFASFLAWLGRNADPEDVRDAKVRPWRWNDEAREAGVL